MSVLPRKNLVIITSFLFLSSSAWAESTQLSRQNTAVSSQEEVSSNHNFWRFGYRHFKRLISDNSAEIEKNSTAIIENAEAILALEAEESVPILELDVDCSVNGYALTEAFEQNIHVQNLRFTLTGECYGDFQSGSSTEPNLWLSSGETRAKIVPNPDTDLTNLRVDTKTLRIENIDLFSGGADENVITIVNNATFNFTGSTITAHEALEKFVEIRASSIGYFSNVELIGGTEDTIGVRVSGNSRLSATDLVAQPGLDFGVDAIEHAMVVFFGENNSVGHVNATQSGLKITSQAALNAGDIRVYSQSSFHMSSNSHLEVTGRLRLSTNSSFRGRNTLVNGDVYVERGSALRSHDNLVINQGRLRVRQGSTATITEGEILTALPTSTGLEVTNSSDVTFLSDDDSVPFTITGRALVENSALNAEDVLFVDELTLRFGATAIFENVVLYIAEDVQDSSEMFLK